MSATWHVVIRGRGADVAQVGFRESESIEAAWGDFDLLKKVELHLFHSTGLLLLLATFCTPSIPSSATFFGGSWRIEYGWREAWAFFVGG